MTPRNHTTGSLVFTIAFAVTLLPAAALAQAGLSGDPFSGQEAERLGRSSQFDKGFQSKSALGQLEELTGTKVNRPSSQRTVVPRAAAQARSVTPRFDANQMFRQELAGAVVGALFANIFADNSAQERAAAEAAAAQRAAQAAAEAEAFRVQQELARQARIRQAQRYRAEWDARETEVTDRLGGAFDVAPATSFFGRPANPDADVIAKILSQDVGGGAPPASGGVPDAFASDPSVVDLRGSSLVVQPFQPPTGVAVNGGNPTMPPLPTRASVTSRWTDDWPEAEVPPLPKVPPSQLKGLLAFFGPELRDYYQGLAMDTAKETIWGRLEHIPGAQYAQAIVGFEGNRTEMTEEMNEAYNPLLRLGLGGAMNAANSLGSLNSSGDGLAEAQFGSLKQDAGKFVVDDWKMIFKQITGHFGGIDLGKMGPISVNGDIRPLNDVPVHVDYPRIKNILFGE